jgi:uncharacterized membrane protein (GlpM family)
MNDRSNDEVRAEAGKLRTPPARDWLIRFAFGAGVSALAGVVSEIAGPRVGGLFLAFPAILLASLTLVAKEEGINQARDDARGAIFGTIGLLAFAVVVAAAATRWPLWATLTVATASWAVIALGAYGIARGFGVGGDESYLEQ